MRSMGRNKTFIIIALLALAVIAAGIAAIYYSQSSGLPFSFLGINGKRIANVEPGNKGQSDIIPPVGRISPPPPGLRKSAGSIEIIYPAGGELLQTGVAMSSDGNQKQSAGKR